MTYVWWRPRKWSPRYGGRDVHLRFLTYTEAARRHPAETNYIVNELRNSKSKHKNAPAKEIYFSYSRCWCVEGLSVEHTTPEAKLLYRLTRTHVNLLGRIERWRAGIELPHLPLEAVEAAVSTVRQGLHLFEGYAQLSLADRHTKFDAVVAQLKLTYEYAALNINNPEEK